MEKIDVEDNDFYRDLLSQVGPVIAVKDLNLRYVYSNHPKRKWTKNGESEEIINIIGMTDLDFHNGSENGVLAQEEDRKVIETGKPVKYILPIKKNNITRYFEVDKKPYVKNGEIVGVVAIITDVTDKVLSDEKQKKMNEKLKKMTKKKCVVLICLATLIIMFVTIGVSYT